MTVGQYEELQVKEIIICDGFNVRTQADPQGLLDLGDSMDQLGQLCPVLVNRTEAGDVLIAGQRRLEQAIADGRQTIEAKVFTGADDKEVLRMHLAENLCRRNLSPVEEAHGMVRLLKLGYTINQVAAECRSSSDMVRRRLKLLELPDEVQQMISRDHFPMPVHQAQLLCGMSDSKAIEMARKIAPITGPVATEEQAKAMIEEASGQGKLPSEESRITNHECESQTTKKKRGRGRPKGSKNKKDSEAKNHESRIKNIERKHGLPGPSGDLPAAKVRMVITGNLRISGDAFVTVEKTKIHITHKKCGIKESSHARFENDSIGIEMMGSAQQICTAMANISTLLQESVKKGK